MFHPASVISKGDLDALEVPLGFSLPEDYRQFMVVHNGGIPEISPTKFCIPLAQHAQQYLQRELAANKATGERRTPEGFVWHHVDDGQTMQLVPYDIHLLTGRHSSIYQYQEKHRKADSFARDRISAISRPDKSSKLHGGAYDAVQLFFSVGAQAKTRDLEWNYNALSGRLPRDLLPIACDGSGNIVSLALSGRDRGTVYFWDWYQEDVPPSYKNMYFVADSFTRFLATLRAEVSKE